MTDAFAYAELDEILRGPGRNGSIGMSAINGLVAALVAAPSFVHPDEWIPLIFGGRQPPLHENSSELRAVKTIFNRYNEVSEILADQPEAYRPIFMIDDVGGIVARDWAVGFALGIGLRSEAWGKRILLTKHRDVLTPILVYCEGNLDLLPDMSAAEKRRRQATAHAQIAQAVAAARNICNPYRPPKRASSPPGSDAPLTSADSPRRPSGSVKPHHNGGSAPLTPYRRSSGPAYRRTAPLELAARRGPARRCISPRFHRALTFSRRRRSVLAMRLRAARICDLCFRSRSTNGMK